MCIGQHLTANSLHFLRVNAQIHNLDKQKTAQIRRTLGNMRMDTISDKISKDLDNLSIQLLDFVRTNTRLKRVFFPGDMSFSTSGDFSFEDLEADAIPIQDRLYKNFNKTFDLIDFLLADSPKDHTKEFTTNRDIITEFILQNSMTWCISINEIATKSEEAVKSIQTILNTLFVKGNQIPLFIPDTNALYANTEPENWNFDDASKFEIIITPSVLKDLDRHKIEHRNEEIRNKAIKLINKIKEFRRRGKLTEGVNVTKDKIVLRTVATEPDFSKALKWLDHNNDDDRLIAEILEIMKQNCDRPVLIVTADINLQNKCEFVDLPFLEPPLKT